MKNQPDPQHLLPEPLRETWVVAPKRDLGWLAVSVMLLSIGFALTVLGRILPPSASDWALPIAAVVCFVGRRLQVPAEKRTLDQLREHLPED